MRKLVIIALTTVALTLFGVAGAAADQPAQQMEMDAALAEAPLTEAPAEVPSPNEPLFLAEESAADEAPVEQCGVRVCPRGLVCCNASCGICVEPGEFCIQIACDHPGGQNPPSN